MPSPESYNIVKLHVKTSWKLFEVSENKEVNHVEVRVPGRSVAPPTGCKLKRFENSSRLMETQ